MCGRAGDVKGGAARVTRVASVRAGGQREGRRNVRDASSDVWAGDVKGGAARVTRVAMCGRADDVKGGAARVTRVASVRVRAGGQREGRRNVRDASSDVWAGFGTELSP